MAEVIHVVDPGEGTGHDYHSLSLWDAGEAGDLTSGPRAGEIAVAKCRATGGTADTTVCDLDGWTTSATCYIKIWTDPTEAYRHAGVWSTDKYRLVTSNDFQMYVREQYVRFDGIQFGLTGTITAARTPFYFLGFSSTSNAIWMGNCIFTGHSNASYQWKFVDPAYIPIQLTIWNCIVYGHSANSNSYMNVVGDANAVVSLYGCTIIGDDNATACVRREAGTLTVKNTYACGGSVGAFVGTISGDYNASDDTSASMFTHNLQNVAKDTSTGTGHAGFTNVTGGSEDFRIKDGSALQGAGTTLTDDPPGSTALGVDIAGTTRS